jgi:hypothetical protein
MIMSSKNKLTTEAQQFLTGKSNQPRKLYSKPRLDELGDLRTLTLGASPTEYLDSGGSLYTETFPDSIIPNPPPIQ